jgi:hypothetical protein
MVMRESKEVSDGWTPSMERRAADPEGRQVKCLTSDAGHIWMPSYDHLPSPVRRRLAESRFNICAACLDIDAHTAASKRGQRKPTVAIYFAVIEAIERELEQQNNE